MGKKKNNKNKNQGGVNGADDLPDIVGETTTNPQQKSGGKKKKRKDDDNWEDEVFNEINQMKNPEQSKDEDKGSGEKTTEVPKDDAAKPEPPTSNNKKKKNAKKQNSVEEDPTKLASNQNGSIETDAGSSQQNADEKPKNDDNDQKEPSATTSKKKKKKGDKKTKEKEEKKTRRPNAKMIALMQESLQKQKEEKERREREEEERIRKEEEAEQKRLHEIEQERLKKERKKQLKKDRIKRMKEEGTYKTDKQKKQDKINQARVEALKAQGLVPTVAEGTTKKPKYERLNKKKPKIVDPVAKIEEKKVEISEKNADEKDCWDEESSDDWENQIDSDEESPQKDAPRSDDSEDDDGSDEDQHVVVVKSKPSQVADPKERISKRKKAAEANRSTDNLRAPVICVMGHVDTGKTKILDKLRHTNVQDGEAGGITQQIGATNVPTYAIKEQTTMVKDFDLNNMKIPGLLIIDTPGHESFTNLRSRGSSNCDMAILVVDIMHGLENQTIESINLLRKRKVPFVIALNKIDRLYEWNENPNDDVHAVVTSQKQHVQDEFRKRVNEVIVQFALQNLNVKLFYENEDAETWISMIPTSAHSGDGMGNLMAYVVQYCQNRLAERLSFSEELQCTVLEVKGSQGLGTTVDVLLINGSLKYGDTIVLAGQEGPIVTHVKGLLMPEPLKEFRVKNAYTTHSKVTGAQGVRISAKELDKALAGTSLLVAKHDDEIDILRAESQEEVAAVLGNIKVQDKGVFVQASTLGSLEALLEFLRSQKIPYAGINIGPVHKKDVMRTSVMLERDEQWAVIMAFDVKVEREAQEHADHLGVQIFTADIIYHLQDQFLQYRDEMKKRKQAELADRAIFPCKLRILPNHVFKTRDPIVVGVRIEAGQLHVGTPLCVIERNKLFIGKVTSMESNHKQVEKATTSEEVCIKIEGPPGDPPKMVGRHFEETDLIVSEISRDTINILKDWFRDRMNKSDWQLIIELKKKFEIL